METVRIPNAATYSPIPLADFIAVAPLATRVLIGVSPLGRAIQMAAMGAYAGSALIDWMERQGIRRVDFVEEFGADVTQLDEMPAARRLEDMAALADRLNDGFTSERRSREKLAEEVDHHLTSTIASMTQQRIETSLEIRNFGLASLVFPFAVGSCDILSGDVALYRDTGFFEPHVIAHEFCHRKGYWKELHAQVLAYIALARSGDPLLVQSALIERLHRNMKVIADENREHYFELLQDCKLRPELDASLNALWPETGGTLGKGLADTMKSVYDQRMRLTGQNGISDYDRGFTNFLYTFEQSTDARQNAATLAL